MSATEPSAEARKAALAIQALPGGTCPPEHREGGWYSVDCPQCLGLALDAYAASRARSYAIEQLEEVAKKQCHRCESEPPIYKPNNLDWWWHPPTETWSWTLCGAGNIQDRIRLLRDQGTGAKPVPLNRKRKRGAPPPMGDCLDPNADDGE